MSKLKIFGRRKKSFLRDESGATAVEYGLVLALVVGIVVAAFGTDNDTGLRGAVTDMFTNLGTTLTEAVPDPGNP